jgi:hypothetical protein
VTVPDHLVVSLTYTVSGNATSGGKPVIPAAGGTVTLAGTVNGPNLNSTFCRLTASNEANEINLPDCNFTGEDLAIGANTDTYPHYYEFSLNATDYVADENKTFSVSIEQQPMP